MKVKTQSKKVNKAWLHDHVTDPYVRMAQAEGYRARAAYKLKEIDEAHRTDQAGPGGGRPGQPRPAPGASTCAAASRPRWRRHRRRGVGRTRRHLIALDMLPMEPIEGVHFIQGDFREDSRACRSSRPGSPAGPVDVVVSDMAPNLSGIERPMPRASADLVELAVEFRRPTPETRRRAGGQGIPRQWLQPAGGALQAPSGWSNRSSPRHRATSRPKPFWSASGLKVQPACS
jgi:23S rRNA (uridine2552-2'-O)-methyltransferase